MSQLRNLPKVDLIAQNSALQSFSSVVQRDAARKAIAWARSCVQAGEEAPTEIAIIEYAAIVAAQMTMPSVKRVINASGVILHTGIGRARLAPAASEAVALAAQNHAAVEIDLESGRRGDRQLHVKELLCQLTGAQDAFVVNNCAAAVFLALMATSRGEGVLLSRGQMVEIGGSFRMPDIVKETGCNLIEVGCTNKTRLSDYQSDQPVASILRCHPSNFQVVGFVEEPSVEELAAHAHQNGWILIDDLGSGALEGMLPGSMEPEPHVQRSIQAGADLVLFSGDKLLGASQAGIILGSTELIAKIRSHPMARAVRIDKLCLAGLEATLRLHTQDCQQEIPTFWAIHRPLEEVRKLAQRIKQAIGSQVILESGTTEVGGGSAPGSGIPTIRVGIRSSHAENLAKRLRTSEPAILARIEKEMVWLDPRTITEPELREVIKVLKSILL